MRTSTVLSFAISVTLFASVELLAQCQRGGGRARGRPPANSIQSGGLNLAAFPLAAQQRGRLQQQAAMQQLRLRQLIAARQMQAEGLARRQQALEAEIARRRALAEKRRAEKLARRERRRARNLARRNETTPDSQLVAARSG